MLAVDLQNPLFWAIIVGWILTVAVHEFAHGLVAWLGGDYTIRERGGLTLNPFHYIDPMMSIVLPTIFLLIGGIPLPGGATYVRTDLLRGRGWTAAVGLAGPASNFILFLLCALPLHPALGWLNAGQSVNDASNAQIFLGAMAVLQFIATILNLTPIPPLDGFGVLSPFMPPEQRRSLMTPPLSIILLVAFFAIIFLVPGAMNMVIDAMGNVLEILHFNERTGQFMVDCWAQVMGGR
jgi:Zn-dependent protease